MIKTDGNWPKGDEYLVMSDEGYICYPAVGVGYTRQQYEQCLRKITRRPPIDIWPEGYNWFAVDRSGIRNLFKSKPHVSGNGFEWDDHSTDYKELPQRDMEGLDWKKTLMSREEAEKRDAIIDSDNDDDWFRNGETPSVGTMVDLDTGLMNTGYEVLAVHKDFIWLKKEGNAPISWSLNNIFPSGYDMGAIREEAVNLNNAMRVNDIMGKYGYLDAREMIFAMIKDGVL